MVVKLIDSFKIFSGLKRLWSISLKCSLWIIGKQTIKEMALGSILSVFLKEPPPWTCPLTEFVRLERSLAISSSSWQTSTDFLPWCAANVTYAWSALYVARRDSMLGIIGLRPLSLGVNGRDWWWPSSLGPSAWPLSKLHRLARRLPQDEYLAGEGGATAAARFLRRAAVWQARATRAFFELLLVAIRVKGAEVNQVGRAKACKKEWKEGFGR